VEHRLHSLATDWIRAVGRRDAEVQEAAVSQSIAHDSLGPAAVVELHDARVGLAAFVVIYNIAAGPAIGGVRMAADVTVDEVCRLARAMTLKNAAAGLPHGGGKAGIVADPKQPRARKQALVRAFARAIAELASYIPGPDMGTDETAMAWIHDEIGRAVGLPRVLGGIPLDTVGATGLGLAVAAAVAAPLCDVEIGRARVAVQGFGAVGQHAARLLAERDARVVAVSDSRGAIVNGDGLDVAALVAHKQAGRGVRDFAGGQAFGNSDLVDVDCEIWIPAARPDVLRRDNVERLRARLVLQGANIPVSDDAERRLHERGVLSLPDFIANAGGVICAAVEYAGGSEAQALATIADRIAANTREVIERSQRDRMTPRQAALAIAHSRVEEAMSYRRPFAATAGAKAQPRTPRGAEPFRSFDEDPE
jgi:glutamate dehydrogenase (NAD(P)+)